MVLGSGPIRGRFRCFANSTPGLKMADARFARRVLAAPAGQLEVACLKAMGAGRQGKFVAVGSGGDFEVPPAPPDSFPAGPQGSIVYTCRFTFDLGDLNPATAMLRCDYVARNTVVAIRFNGKPIPCDRPAGADAQSATKAFGEILVNGGLSPGRFLPTNNVLEIDVNNDLPSNPPRMLWLRPEVSGIRYP
jgi:hypothetical protein